MKIVSSANMKGGVGKTAVSVHQAFYMAEMKHRVVMLDLDPQGNASTTLRRYASGVTSSAFFADTTPALPSLGGNLCLVEADQALVNLEKPDLGGLIENLRRNLDSISEHFDVCIIDNAPNKGQRTIAALFVSDFVYSPLEVETYSMDGVKQLLQTIIGVKNIKAQRGLQLDFLGMLPNKVNNTSPIHLENLKTLTSGQFAHMVLPFKISQRTSVGEALRDGIPVWESKKKAAKEAAVEFRHALAELQRRMGLESTK
jgi:chromosome partitioning protein